MVTLFGEEKGKHKALCHSSFNFFDKKGTGKVSKEDVYKIMDGYGKCPEGHGLEKYVATGEEGCDLCDEDNNGIAAGTSVYGCRDCDWDSCQSCH